MKSITAAALFVAAAIAQDTFDSCGISVAPDINADLDPSVLPIGVALVAINASTYNLDEFVNSFDGSQTQIDALLGASGSLLQTIKDGTDNVAAIPELTEDQNVFAFSLPRYVGSLACTVNFTIDDLIGKKQILVDSCKGPTVLEQLQLQNEASKILIQTSSSKLYGDTKELAAQLSQPILDSIQAGVDAFADQTSLPASCSTTTSTGTSTKTPSSTPTGTVTSTKTTTNAGPTTTTNNSGPTTTNGGSSPTGGSGGGGSSGGGNGGGSSGGGSNGGGSSGGSNGDGSNGDGSSGDGSSGDGSSGGGNGGGSSGGGSSGGSNGDGSNGDGSNGDGSNGDGSSGSGSSGCDNGCGGGGDSGDGGSSGGSSGGSTPETTISIVIPEPSSTEPVQIVPVAAGSSFGINICVAIAAAAAAAFML